MANVDVLIPHFNDPSGLAASLASIRDQTWTGSFRVVVCDDGSADHALGDAQSALEQSGLEYVLLSNPTNRGRPYTRNRLLDAIECPYVSWLDAGDVWALGKTALQMEALFGFMQKAKSIHNVWVTCSYLWQLQNGKPKAIAQKTEGDQIKAMLIGTTLRAYLWTLLGPASSFKKIGRFDERLPRLQDLDFFISFLSRGGTIISTDSKIPLCTYFKSDVGRDARQVSQCLETVFEKHHALIGGYGRRFAQMRRFRGHMLAARFADNNEDPRAAAAFFVRAAMTCPGPFAAHVLRNGFRP